MNNKFIALITVLVLAFIFVLYIGSHYGGPSQTATTTPTTVGDNTNGLTQVYNNSTKGFSIRYPAGFVVDETYVYQALGPGKNIVGTKFTIPFSTSAGTNLSSDSYISVEQIPQAGTCSASLFLSPGSVTRGFVEGDTTYSLASTSDAGAGNRYEETIYAISGTNPCLAIRYFVHYSVIDNYPAGTVNEFDKQSLINQFDSIRRSLVIQQ